MSGICNLRLTEDGNGMALQCNFGARNKNLACGDQLILLVAT